MKTKHDIYYHFYRYIRQWISIYSIISDIEINPTTSEKKRIYRETTTTETKSSILVNGRM